MNYIMSYSKLTIIFILSVTFFSCSSEDLNIKPQNNSKLPEDIHVILIGLDGWGGYSLSSANMPFVKSLMEDGAFTLHKYSNLPSVSATNWASLYMGVPPEVHGYLNWDSKAPEIDYSFTVKNNIFPTIFQIFKEQQPYAISSLFYSWEGIKYLVDTLSIDNVVQIPYYGDKVEELNLNNKFHEHIMTVKPKFCNIYYSEPDETGHKYGFQSREYYNKLQLIDSYIYDIIQATKDSGIFKNTVFIITSDHGGIDKQHGGNTLFELETPLIFYGSNVKKGEINKLVMQYDVGATIAWLLGLEMPFLWVGRPLVECFENQ